MPRGDGPAPHTYILYTQLDGPNARYEYEYNTGITPAARAPEHGTGAPHPSCMSRLLQAQRPKGPAAAPGRTRGTVIPLRRSTTTLTRRSRGTVSSTWHHPTCVMPRSRP